MAPGRQRKVYVPLVAHKLLMIYSLYIVTESKESLIVNRTQLHMNIKQFISVL